MDQQDGTETETETEGGGGGGEELRCFARVTFPATNEMRVELGTLGTRPAEGVPLNISRGGMQTRIGATMFDGSEGDELLISFTDAAGRLVPDRVLRVDTPRREEPRLLPDLDRVCPPARARQFPVGAGSVPNRSRRIVSLLVLVWAGGLFQYAEVAEDGEDIAFDVVVLDQVE